MTNPLQEALRDIVSNTAIYGELAGEHAAQALEDYNKKSNGSTIRFLVGEFAKFDTVYLGQPSQKQARRVLRPIIERLRAHA